MVEAILNKVIDSSHFTEWKLDEHRSYQPGVPKAHYKFSFDTKMQGSGTMLLDVLIEDSLFQRKGPTAVLYGDLQAAFRFELQALKPLLNKKLNIGKTVIQIMH